MGILAREVRERLKGKIDPDLLKVLEVQSEDLRHLKQGLIQAADATNKLATHLNELANVMGMFKHQVQKLKTKGILIDDEHDDGEPTH